MNCQHRQGMVLLVVLVVVMLLSLAAYEYVFLTQTEHMAAALGGERMVARQAALSARDLLGVMLEMPRAQRDALGGLENNPDYFAGDATLLSMTAEMMPGEDLPGETSPLTIGLIAYPLAEGDSSDDGGRAAKFETGRGPGAEPNPSAGPPPINATRYGAINESSKLHLIKLLEFESEQPGRGVAALLQLPGMDQATAESLMDWMDADDQPRPEGAESEFYGTLSPRLVPRQGLPLDLEELLLVRGVTQARLFDVRMPALAADSMNSTLAPTASQDPISALPWSEFITVYSSERNETYNGQPRIFVNRDDLRELHRELTELLPEEWADFIVLYRQYGAADSMTATVGDEVPAVDFAEAAKFLLESPLDLVNAVVRYTGADETVMVASPFRDDPASLRSQLPVLLDAITLLPEQRVVGRININLARAEVLACLPLEADAVEAILRARESPPVDRNVRNHPIWLWTEGLVDQETMRLILPHLTCGGDVYRAEIWGYVDDRTPRFHLETVLDASTGRSQPVFYRELAAPRNAIHIPSADPGRDLGPPTASSSGAVSGARRVLNRDPPSPL